jgi:PBP1b-binding outer membrane lipoprotein LpoB
MKKNFLSAVVLVLVIAFFTSGCVEHRYFRENKHHSPKYNERHERERGERHD